MSVLKSEDSSKWINALVILFAAICGFVLTRLLEQMAVWFDLEAKIGNFIMLSQALGFLTAIGVFVYVIKAHYTSTYLQDVYKELLRVVWPAKETTIRMTLGLVVALIVTSAIFMVVDLVFKKLLELVY